MQNRTENTKVLNETKDKFEKCVKTTHIITENLSHLVELVPLKVVMLPQSQAIVDPPPAHQLVHQNHLRRCVEQVEQLQPQELVGVGVALGLELAIAAEQPVHPLLPLLLLQLRRPHIQGAKAEPASLKFLPDLSRGVEHERLEEMSSIKRFLEK